MLARLCLFKKAPSWMAPLALLLLQQGGFGFFSVLFTSLAVLLSTVLYIWKHKAVPVDKLVKENVLSSAERSSDERENIAAIPMRKNKTVTEAKETQEEQVSDCVAYYSTTSLDKLSESECQEQLSTSEDSDLDHSPDYSEGSISDEDGLIEIALTSGHSLGQQKEEPMYNCSSQQKKRKLSAESLFSQQSLMEFLAEFNDMNEEENLIEIDISMGSIKCSKFEIEA